jgi:hypothetical protein
VSAAKTRLTVVAGDDGNEVVDEGGAHWTPGRATTDHSCEHCGRAIPAGTEAWVCLVADDGTPMYNVRGFENMWLSDECVEGVHLSDVTVAGA